MKVGVIGNGFVGESHIFAYSPVAEVRVFDVDPLKSTHSLEDVCQCEVVFVCVPTPMKANGEQDLFYIESVFKSIRSTGITGSVFVIKSTVLPGTTARLSKDYPMLRIVFSPEFLTERTAKLDMLTQGRIVLGGIFQDRQVVKKLVELRFKNKHIIETDSTSAELVKYMNNAFFATKVSFVNEFKRLSDSLGADWEDVLYGFASDGRVADSHLQVPGPDGKLGYGGSCFPKDVCAITKLAKDLGVPLNSVEGGWTTNLQVRPEKDWESLKGRAVSHE